MSDLVFGYNFEYSINSLRKTTPNTQFERDSVKSPYIRFVALAWFRVRNDRTVHLRKTATISYYSSSLPMYCYAVIIYTKVPLLDLNGQYSTSNLAYLSEKL